MAGGPTWLTKRDLPAHRDGYNYRRSKKASRQPHNHWIPSSSKNPNPTSSSCSRSSNGGSRFPPLLSAPLRSSPLDFSHLICHLSARIPPVSFESFLTYSSQFRCFLLNLLSSSMPWSPRFPSLALPPPHLLRTNMPPSSLSQRRATWEEV